MWREILSDEFLVRPRMSRIYYRNRFFHYPLKPGNALQGLGPVEASHPPLVPPMACLPAPPGRDLRAMGHQPIRPSPV